MATRGSACQFSARPRAFLRDNRASTEPSSEPALPNLLVPIDLRDGTPTGPSLFALCESRRIAREAGVTVFAVVLTDPRPQHEAEKIAARLGLAGADKVLVCEAPGLGGPPLDATH